jgi:cytochrome P450
VPTAAPALTRSPLPTMADIARGGVASLARWAAEHGDWVEAGDDDGPALFLNHPDAVRAVLRQPDTVLSGARTGPSKVLIGNGPLSGRGDRWHHQRRSLLGGFREETQAHWLPQLGELARQRAARWHAAGAINLPHETSRLAQDMMARVIFGTAGAAALDGFVDALTRVMDDTAPITIEAEQNGGSIFGPLIALLAAADVIHVMIKDGIAAGRATGAEWHRSTAGRWFGERTDEPTEDDVYLFTTLMVVSVLTMGPVLFWTLYHLGQLPHAWERARAEGGDPDHAHTVRGALLEAIRLYPPYWIVTKTAHQKTTIAGLEIEEGSRVHVIPWLTQRDPRWFDDPQQFDPSRWDNGRAPHELGAAFLPFLMGQRACPARSLAWPDMLAAIAAIVTTSQPFTAASAQPPEPVVHSLALRIPERYDGRFAPSTATMRSSLV